jgi:Family of unknown function (DUF5681)
MTEMTTATENTQPKHSNLRPWRPGESGNPAGRPKGSRSRLSEGFISSLAADFERHGVAVIEQVRTKNPLEYLQIIARVMPRELDVQVSTYADVASIAEAYKVAMAILHSDTSVLSEHMPQLLEHDDGT